MAFDFTGGKGKQNEKEKTGFDFTVAPKATPKKTVITKPKPMPVVSEPIGGTNLFNQLTQGLIKGASLGLLQQGGPFDRAISKLLGLPEPVEVRPTTTAQKAANIAGDLIGAALPISKLYSIGRAIAPTTGVGKALIPGAVAGGGYEGIRSTAQGEPLPIIARNVALGGALGGGGDVAIRAAAPIARNLFSTPKGALQRLDLRDPVQVFKATTPPPRVTRSGGTGELLTPARPNAMRFLPNEPAGQLINNIGNMKTRPLPEPKTSKPRSGYLVEPETIIPEQQAAREVAPLIPQPVKAQIETPKTIEQRIRDKEIGYTLDENKAVAEEALKTYDVTKLKDIGSIKAQHMDIFRMVSEVFGGNIFKGKDTPIKRLILDPFDRAKGEMVDFEKQMTTELRKNIISKGFGKGSKKSALLQDFGERKLVPGGSYEENLAELQRRRPRDWQTFVEADKWFRQQYDNLLEQVNNVYREVYGHDSKLLAEKLVPRRKDYYRHFQEMGNAFKEIKSMVETPANIDPTLVGQSEYMRPRSRWLSFAQKRGLGPYKKDAVGGFIDYLKAASYHKHITPHIGRLQELGKALAEHTQESKNLNNFIQALQRHEQALAGKTNIADRFIQEYIGRGPYRILNWINNRVRANAILGNAGTLIAQGSHIPMAIGVGKQHAARGLTDTFRTILRQMSGKGSKEPIAQSPFMKERYSAGIFSQFDRGITQRGLNSAAWLLETSDRIATSFTWNTMYRKGLAEGMKDPIKYADDATRAIVAGRGVGEVPYALQSQLSRLAIPFQIEVNNILLVHRDLAKHDKAGLVTLAVAAWLFNRVSEETRGSPLMPDPIMALADAAKELMDEENEGSIGVVKAGARLGGEVLSNMPGGQHLAAAIITDESKRKEYFGRSDPTRYGTGLLMRGAWEEPVYRLLPKFGGGQIKKTVGGAQAIANEGVYTRNNDLMFPVNTDDPSNIIRALTFGKYATKEGREYFDKKQRPLSTKQTEQYKRAARAGRGKSAYDRLQRQRELDVIRRAIKDVQNDKTLTFAQKQERINKLRQQQRKLLSQ